MPKLLIVRGLPGSGKSTYAKSLKDFLHIEADMYFVNNKGEYKYERSKIPEAHTWCQREAACALEQGNNVVVSNTFTQLWEVQPYIDMAKVLNCEWDIVEMTGNYGSIHNIPEDVYKKMEARWWPTYQIMALNGK